MHCYPQIAIYSYNLQKYYYYYLSLKKKEETEVKWVTRNASTDDRPQTTNYFIGGIKDAIGERGESNPDKNLWVSLQKLL